MIASENISCLVADQRLLAFVDAHLSRCAGCLLFMRREIDMEFSFFRPRACARTVGLLALNQVLCLLLPFVRRLVDHDVACSVFVLRGRVRGEWR